VRAPGQRPGIRSPAPAGRVVRSRRRRARRRCSAARPRGGLRRRTRAQGRRGRRPVPPASAPHRHSRGRRGRAGARASARPRRCGGRRRPVRPARRTGGSRGTGPGSPSPARHRGAARRAAPTRPIRAWRRPSGAGTRVGRAAAGRGAPHGAAGWRPPCETGRPGAASRTRVRCRSPATRSSGSWLPARRGGRVRRRGRAGAAGPVGSGCLPTSRGRRGRQASRLRWPARSSRCPGRAGERSPAVVPGGGRAAPGRSGAAWTVTPRSRRCPAASAPAGPRPRRRVAPHRCSSPAGSLARTPASPCASL